MQAQRWLPLESGDREQRRRLWNRIPQQDQNEFIVRCASLIARAADRRAATTGGGTCARVGIW
jgi:hypothetical protein